MMNLQLAFASAREEAKPLQMAINAANHGRVGSASSSIMHVPVPKAAAAASAGHDGRFHIKSWDLPPLPNPDVGEVTEADTLFREQAHHELALCLDKELAASTLTTYNALLENEVQVAERNYKTKLLPMSTEAQFFGLFAVMKARRGEDLHWSRVRGVRAAVAKWHARNEVPCVMDVWLPKMVAFWNGLSRNCRHDTVGKEPVKFHEVVEFLQKAAGDQQPAVIRAAAMASVSFFQSATCVGSH